MPGGALEAEEQQQQSVFVGRKLDEHRGAFVLEYPMDKGAVTDDGWDAMERLWDVSFYYCIFVLLLGSCRLMLDVSTHFVRSIFLSCVACLLETIS